MFSRSLCWLIVFSFATLCYAEEPLGLVTVVEGDATLVRHTTKLMVKPGMRLMALDLLKTESNASIIRIEFFDGAIADLGRQTEVMLSPKLSVGSKKTRQAPLYALSGWIKLSGNAGNDLAASQLLSESLDISGLSGNTVVSVGTTTNQVFAESGSVSVTYRRKGKEEPLVTLKPGMLWESTGNNKASTSTHPPIAFMKSVPTPFLDPIPARTKLFKGRAETPTKILGDLSYAEAAPWLRAELPVRALLVAHWKPYLNSDLRTGLARNIQVHPEWSRVLIPEKQLPTSAESVISAITPAPR